MDELLENQAWDLCVKINGLIEVECFGKKSPYTPTVRKKRLVYIHARAYARFLRRQDNSPPPIGDDHIHLDEATEYVMVDKIKHREYIENNNRVLDGAFVLLNECKRRNVQDERRVENRQDQVDKRAFQAAVMANIDYYDTKADAIRDLRIKPQFENYPDNTLRGWLTAEVWTKPTKRGRLKK